MKLTTEEKAYLWSKLEYTKKKKAEESKSSIYEILKGDKEDITDEDFIKVLNCLEFTVRKKLKGQDKPMNTEMFKSLMEKVPESWVGVNFSSLDAKKRQDEKAKEKEEKKPTRHVEGFDSFQK